MNGAQGLNHPFTPRGFLGRADTGTGARLESQKLAAGQLAIRPGVTDHMCRIDEPVLIHRSALDARSRKVCTPDCGNRTYLPTFTIANGKLFEWIRP
jgi:hypothetical protein